MLTLISSILLELTFQEIIADIPRDTGAVVTLLLVGVFIGFIWHGSRSGGRGGESKGGTS